MSTSTEYFHFLYVWKSFSFFTPFLKDTLVGIEFWVNSFFFIYFKDVAPLSFCLYCFICYPYICSSVVNVSFLLWQILRCCLLTSVKYFIIMCLSVIFFITFVFEIYLNFWLCGFIVFIIFRGNFEIILQIFFLPSLLLGLCYTYIKILKLSHSSLMLFSF